MVRLRTASLPFASALLFAAACGQKQSEVYAENPPGADGGSNAGGFSGGMGGGGPGSGSSTGGGVISAGGSSGSSSGGQPGGTSSSSGSSSGGSSSGSSSSGGNPIGGGYGYCGSPGLTCCASPGQTPNPECDDGDEAQCAQSTACSIAATCGSTSTCEPLADNAGSAVENFRMRRVVMVAPPKLANQTVQTTVITDGVDMAEQQCGEEGTGDFNWLLSFDTTSGILTTGGAPPCNPTDTPACDPLSSGYCFLHKNVNGIVVGPVTASYSTALDQTLQTQPGEIPELDLPIYFGTPSSIILLPVSNAVFMGITLSDEGNCIGSVNPNALAADCSDSYLGCSKWKTDGSFTGYILLKTANSVEISILSETLCSLLTGDTTGTPLPDGAKTCATDSVGDPLAKGDYCSSLNEPGECGDAVWFAATFAASAVNINDGTGVADCTGQ